MELLAFRSATARLTVVQVFCGAFVLTVLPVPAHALPPGEVFNKVKDAVVVVKSFDAQGRLKGQGSGVVISPDRVATNCHVVEGGAAYQVSRGEHRIAATLYAEDWDKDICLLDAKGLQGQPAQFGKAATLKVGDRVYAVGAPQGLELSLSDGIVAQLRGGPPPLIQTTTAISPGSSGGGLFDERGRLVGLTTLYLSGGQSLNFAMPVEWIGDVRPGRKRIAEGLAQAEWAKRALALQQAKDWQGLLDWCRKWTQSDPENADAWHNLAGAYGELQLFTDAIDAERQALRRNPDFSDGWTYLSGLYVMVQRPTDAIGAAQQAIRLKPEEAEGWHLLGMAYYSLQRYAEAVDAYRKAIRLKPEEARFWRSLGALYDSRQHYADAIDAFRQAIRLEPEEPNAWFSLGIAYSELASYADAIGAHRQAIRLKPEEPIFWYGLGTTYAKSGNRTAALECVRELRRLDPTRADQLFNVIMPR